MQQLLARGLASGLMRGVAANCHPVHGETEKQYQSEARERGRERAEEKSRERDREKKRDSNREKQ